MRQKETESNDEGLASITSWLHVTSGGTEGRRASKRDSELPSLVSGSDFADTSLQVLSLSRSLAAAAVAWIINQSDVVCACVHASRHLIEPLDAFMVIRSDG